MKKDATSFIDSNTRTQIRSMKKHVTVLFTDIVESTKYWDKFGDVQGRLMVDRHNRILFPLVARFKGRIIKTIGDSIMAAFSKPEYAIEAAVAMQQAMAMERQGDDTFKIQIRIGIHTGDAIVEKGDVYGDLVNVTARIESIAKEDEILVSRATAAYVDDEYAFIFRRKGWFVPKGKNKKLYVYSCDWQNHPRLIDEVVSCSSLPVTRRQKQQLGIFITTIFATIYFIYLKYLRYLISDSEEVALKYLNLGSILEYHPYLVGFAGILLLILVILFIRMRMIPISILRLIKGGFIFAIAFVVIYTFTQYIPIKQNKKWDEVIDSSQHQYVEVLENNSTVFKEPSFKGQELKQIKAGHLLLQKDFVEVDSLAWNKVLLDKETYGWIVSVSPPKMGVPEKIVSETYRFNFRYKDLYTFAMGFLCFMVGIWRIRIRPI